MSSVDPSIQTTVRHLESVTSEIENLRDAVAGHRNASLGLEAIATTLTELALQLQRLPVAVRGEFAGISELIVQVKAAMQPAGSLESAIREIVRSNEQLSSKLQRDHETLSGEMRAVRDEIGSLRALMGEQFLQTRSGIEKVTEQAKLSDDQLTELRKSFGNSSSTQARETEAIKSRLAKLTGLARRGFFALLRGKDAPAEPL